MWKGRFFLYAGGAAVFLVTGFIYGFTGFYGNVWPFAAILGAAILAIEIGAYVRKRKYRNK
jgi:hypothetical protein